MRDQSTEELLQAAKDGTLPLGMSHPFSQLPSLEVRREMEKMGYYWRPCQKPGHHGGWLFLIWCIALSTTPVFPVLGFLCVAIGIPWLLYWLAAKATDKQKYYWGRYTWPENRPDLNP